MPHSTVLSRSPPGATLSILDHWISLSLSRPPHRGSVTHTLHPGSLTHPLSLSPGLRIDSVTHTLSLSLSMYIERYNELTGCVGRGMMQHPVLYCCFQSSLIPLNRRTGDVVGVGSNWFGNRLLENREFTVYCV